MESPTHSADYIGATGIVETLIVHALKTDQTLTALEEKIDESPEIVDESLGRGIFEGFGGLNSKGSLPKREEEHRGDDQDV